MSRSYIFLVGLIVFGMLTSPMVHAGNKKLMSIQAAKADGSRAIAESVVGLKVKGEQSVVDMVAQRHTIKSEVRAAMVGINCEEDVVYDSEKDIAIATCSIKLGDTQNVIGRRVNYKNLKITRVGFGTSTPEMATPLQAMRAAQIHAYEQLAKHIVGMKIDSKTTVENFILKSDELKTVVSAAIWGAELEKYGWDKDGNAQVEMSLRINYVEDVIKRKFEGDGGKIVVTGMGSQVDDFTPANTPENSDSPTDSKTFQGGGNYREANLGIPVMTQKEKEPEPVATVEEKSDGGGVVVPRHVRIE